MYTICTLYVHYMYTICTLYVHYLYTICTLYVHYMFTICSLYSYRRKVQKHERRLNFFDIFLSVSKHFNFEKLRAFVSLCIVPYKFQSLLVLSYISHSGLACLEVELQPF